MDFSEQEAVDGVRFVWNVWPGSRLDAARLVVPLAVAITPLRRVENAPVLPYEPIACRTCPCLLNPYCRVDFGARAWFCPLCRGRNAFPPHYAQVSETVLPAELYAGYTVVEYAPPAPPQAPPPTPPAFVFLLDLALESTEIEGLRAAVQQALQLVPETALVGLITFGAHVYVHELGHTEMPKAVVLHGDRDYCAAVTSSMLGLGPGSGQRWGATPPGRPPGPGGAANGMAPPRAGVDRFLLPLADADFALDSLIEDLQADSWLPRRGLRPARCTGTAVSVATGLMEAAAAAAHDGGSGGRILLLTGGPATAGPGQVVPQDLGESIRTHKDLDKGDSRLFGKARRHYEGLGDRLAAAGAALDVFACSLDQIGLAEMRPAVSDSGGIMVLAETFEHSIFRQSLARLFTTGPDGHLDQGFNATIEVGLPKEVVVAGAIGSVAGLKRGGPAVAEVSVGEGGTTAWKTCSLTPQSTVTVYLDVATPHAAPAPAGQPLVLQFVTRYRHADGSSRVRVVTTARSWGTGSDQELAQGFDQEAAAAAMARLAAFKAESEEHVDVLRWVDRSLIKLGAKFGSFSKDRPETFQLPDSFGLFPQFMFHLRRSQFLQVFNNTPDETAFARLWLERESTANAMTMVQPALLSYGLDGPPHPVLLDVSSIQPERILLLDAFFLVVVFLGATVDGWRRAGYHENPEHTEFAELLKAPLADAAELTAGRLPVPRIVKTEHNGSQARFLLAKLNPSSTHESQFGPGEIIFTDDVSLQVFLEHLAKLAVSS